VTAHDADRVLGAAVEPLGDAAPRLGYEVVIVLAISLGQSGVYSLLRIIERLTRPQPLGEQSSSLNPSVTPDRPWLDLTYQVVNIAFALVPVLLVLYLLDRTNRPAGRAIGFDLRRPVFDAWFGVLIAACIGVPGLGLYLGARALGLNGAEIVFIPSATTKGHADYLWELEQRAHAVANGYFVGTINRVGTEAPWNIGQFFGSSYFSNPDGRILVKGSEDKDELVVADLNLDEIREVRTHWQFYRDRRPEMYGELTSMKG